MEYKLDYSGGSPIQEGVSAPENRVALAPEASALNKSWRFPPLLQTVLTATLIAVLFFTFEKFGPRDWRPSHLVGSYEADVAAQVEAQVAASRLQQQALFDAWLEEVRLVNGQNLEQYRGLVNAVAAYYQASYDRSRVFAEATARMQSELTQARVRTASQMRAADQSIINLSRLFGLGMNALSPGSGDKALRYSEALTSEVYGELNRAAMNGQAVSVAGWDTGLPSPSEVQSAVNGLNLRPLPPPPNFVATIPPRADGL